MNYALLAYGRDGTWDALSDEEQAAWIADDAAFHVELEDRGIVVSGLRLAATETATTVRIEHGEAVLTDGAYAETADHLGSFLVVDVADLDEALDLARRCPAARIGPLEIRPARSD